MKCFNFFFFVCVNKRIVIFGGTSGIGLATTSMLSEMNAKHIYSISRNPEKSLLSNSNIELVKMDVLDESKLVSFFEKIGRYDILINAATGGERAIGPFMKMDLEGYRNSFKKLWGYTNSVRYGLQNLSKNGCVVLVSGSPASYACSSLVKPNLIDNPKSVESPRVGESLSMADNKGNNSSRNDAELIPVISPSLRIIDGRVRE